MEQRFSISELAELGGVSRRTVRYYVQRGLIPPPIGSGRGAHYTQAHLDALVRTRSLQEQGVSLNQLEAQAGDTVTRDVDGAVAVRAASVVEQSVWTRIVLADGVELQVRRGQALDSATLEALRAAVAEVLRLET